MGCRRPSPSPWKTRTIGGNASILIRLRGFWQKVDVRLAFGLARSGLFRVTPAIWESGFAGISRLVPAEKRDE